MTSKRLSNEKKVYLQNHFQNFFRNKKFPNFILPGVRTNVPQPTSVQQWAFGFPGRNWKFRQKICFFYWIFWKKNIKNAFVLLFAEGLGGYCRTRHVKIIKQKDIFWLKNGRENWQIFSDKNERFALFEVSLKKSPPMKCFEDKSYVFQSWTLIWIYRVHQV